MRIPPAAPASASAASAAVPDDAPEPADVLGADILRHGALLAACEAVFDLADQCGVICRQWRRRRPRPSWRTCWAWGASNEPSAASGGASAAEISTSKPVAAILRQADGRTVRFGFGFGGSRFPALQPVFAPRKAKRPNRF